MMVDEDPAVWGESFWVVMRKIAEQYPTQNPSHEVRTAAAGWFNALGELLPCQKCRENYKAILQKLPLDGYLESSAMLREWVGLVKKEVDAHKTTQSEPVPTPGQLAMARLAARRQEAAAIMQRRAPPQLQPAIKAPPLPPLKRVATTHRGVNIAPQAQAARPGCRTCAGKKRV